MPQGRRPASADFATAFGAHRHDSPQALERECPIVCTNVFADSDVEGLAFGDEGLIQGMPKGGTMDDLVRSCCEAGAAGIIPLETARCELKLDADPARTRRER